VTEIIMKNGFSVTGTVMLNHGIWLLKKGSSVLPALCSFQLCFLHKKFGPTVSSSNPTMWRTTSTANTLFRAMIRYPSKIGTKTEVFHHRTFPTIPNNQKKINERIADRQFKQNPMRQSHHHQAWKTKIS